MLAKGSGSWKLICTRFGNNGINTDISDLGRRMLILDVKKGGGRSLSYAEALHRWCCRLAPKRAERVNGTRWTRRVSWSVAGPPWEYIHNKEIKRLLMLAERTKEASEAVQ
ncbi:hypothetical protein B0H17DRAFT_1134357 [Mycena rosella]|uniref:Uncharacterized protein n=1 Tax=Mycena rosella TaxID=1033263 RepID=A0AAD7DFV1_MYCRO|nr:hypothetical protein B0H17DRAFT_1134357 [Mycena rosella]